MVDGVLEGGGLLAVLALDGRFEYGSPMVTGASDDGIDIFRPDSDEMGVTADCGGRRSPRIAATITAPSSPTAI